MHKLMQKLMFMFTMHQFCNAVVSPLIMTVNGPRVEATIVQHKVLRA